MNHYNTINAGELIARLEEKIKEDIDAIPEEEYIEGKVWLQGRIDVMNELIAEFKDRA